MLKTILAAAAICGMTGGAAQAATMVYATDAQIIVPGDRGTANDRDNIANAFGAADGKFFELGYDAVVDFYFDRDFQGPAGRVVEITFGNAQSWLEGVRIEFGNTVNGVFTLLATATPNPLLNTGNGLFSFSGGPFNTVRLTDVTCRIPGGQCKGSSGGFDVDSISVAAVPVPAAGLLLLSAVGAAAALRRRKRAPAL
jgi:hypothetical protein